MNIEGMIIMAICIIVATISSILLLIINFFSKKTHHCSKEKILTEIYAIISVLLCGMTLLSVNLQFEHVLEARTILLLTSLCGIAAGYFFQGKCILFFSLVGTLLWWTLQAGSIIDSLHATPEKLKYIGILSGISLLSLMYYSIGNIQTHAIKTTMNWTYRFIGLLTITGVLFLLSTQNGILLLEHSARGGMPLQSLFIGSSMIILLCGTFALNILEKIKNNVSLEEMIAVCLLGMLFFLLNFIPESNFVAEDTGSGYNTFNQAGLGFLIAFNILVFLELVGIILLGYKKHEERYINFGSLFLFILIGLKYFDWAFKFIDKSVFFISAGILMFIIGWTMEKGRRYMIENMTKKT